MDRGTVAKIVQTFGSAWGMIERGEGLRKVFFNRASMAAPAEFGDLAVGQEVEFSAVADQVNGFHAEQLTPASAASLSS